MQAYTSVVLRTFGLAVALLVAMGVAGAVSGVTRPPPEAAAAPDPGSAAASLGAFALYCFLVAAAFAWLILRSTLAGWRLVAAVALAHFGLGTLLPQIESLIFLPANLPPGFVPRLFAMGALASLLFAPAAAWILGRGRDAAAPAVRPPLGIPALPAFAARVAALAAAYAVLYFLAGYFIAYRNPELVAFYGDTDPGSFFAQLVKVWRTAPWLYGLQALRGVAWIACVLPFLLHFRGGRVEAALLVGCVYAVWPAMLLAPNPYMPESIRLSHLVETAVSGFVHGLMVGSLLLTPRRPARA